MLQHGMNFDEPPSRMAYVTGKNQIKTHKKDDLLLKPEVLADPKLTVGSTGSDDDMDRILFEASWLSEPVSPPTAERPKMDS